MGETSPPMKTKSLLQLAAACVGLFAFSTAGCAEKEKVVATPSPAAPSPGASDVVTVPAPATVPDASSAQWAEIKDLTFDQREQFFAGLKRLQARVDAQITELTAKRAAMPSTADTKDWDFNMKEMGDSRSYLNGMADEIAKATPETWAQEKDKVNHAWTRTQDAYDKVRTSTTAS